MTGVLGLGYPMSKKRNDKSAKVDSWVLFMVETIVSWRKQTREADEKLTVAEYLSEVVREHAGPEFEQAKRWLALQSDKGPQGESTPTRGRQKKPSPN